MKLSEIINEAGYWSMASEFSPETISKIKKWYDESLTYSEIATRLNFLIGKYTFSSANISNLLDKIYPERNRRMSGGQWRPGNAPARPPDIRRPKDVKNVRKLKSTTEVNEIIDMYIKGVDLLKICKQFSLTRTGIDIIINGQPNASGLRQARRTALGI